MSLGFKEIINSNTPTLVDFYATWCGPCKAMKPVLDELKNKVGNDARILKIDIDKNPAVAHAYKVRSVPTFILFKNGKAIWQQSGGTTVHALKQVIDRYK